MKEGTDIEEKISKARRPQEPLGYVGRTNT
jgi:hypothetical protein